MGPRAQKRFPTLEELPISETNETGYKFYKRFAMLQALWKVAGQDSLSRKRPTTKIRSGLIVQAGTFAVRSLGRPSKRLGTKCPWHDPRQVQITTSYNPRRR